MHFLMSFVGTICIPSPNSGLEEIMKVAFGGVLQMLSGKKSPQNVRTLRNVTEEILKPSLNQADEKLDLYIWNYWRKKLLKARPWVDCLIKPILLIMLYVQAEREAD